MIMKYIFLPLYFFCSEDEPTAKLSVMNAKDRLASPARKGSAPATSSIHNSPSLTTRVKQNSGGGGRQDGAAAQVNHRPTSELPMSSSKIFDPCSDSEGGADNKTTLKIHLVDGGFNVVKCSDTTDVKVSYDKFLLSFLLYPFKAAFCFKKYPHHPLRNAVFTASAQKQ